MRISVADALGRRATLTFAIGVYYPHERRGAVCPVRFLSRGGSASGTSSLMMAIRRGRCWCTTRTVIIRRISSKGVSSVSSNVHDRVLGRVTHRWSGRHIPVMSHLILRSSVWSSLVNG
jgi:hypothetical protein